MTRNALAIYKRTKGWACRKLLDLMFWQVVGNAFSKGGDNGRAHRRVIGVDDDYWLAVRGHKTSLIKGRGYFCPISIGKERDPFHLKVTTLSGGTRLLNRKESVLSGILAP